MVKYPLKKKQVKVQKKEILNLKVIQSEIKAELKSKKKENFML